MRYVSLKALWPCLFYGAFLPACSDTKETRTDSRQTWLNQLPACPCQNPDWSGIKLDDGWAKDKGDIATYHTGTQECFRSYPAIETKEGTSGQQCCYDGHGDLITGGRAAGTPDKESTCSGEDKVGIMTLRLSGVLGHYRRDVQTWKDMGGVDSGWVKYNSLWKPNNGNACRENIVTPKMGF